MSCQNTFNGRVWIEFETLDDMEQFISAVSPDESESLYGRIAWTSGDAESHWYYELIPLDIYASWLAEPADDSETSATTLPLFVLTPSVRFPRSDLAEVQERMAQFNRNVA